MICIVGGSGFIGTRLARRLAGKDTDFKIVDKAPSVAFSDKVTIADVRDMDALKKVVPEESVIINLAAEHRDDVRPKSLYR